MQNFFTFLGILQSIKIKPPVLLWLLYQRNQWRKNGLQWEPCRILIDHTKKYSSGSQIEHMLTNNIKLNEGQRIVSMNPAEYRAISEMMGSYGFAVFFSVMVLLSMFLFIYNILNISLEKRFTTLWPFTSNWCGTKAEY